MPRLFKKGNPGGPGRPKGSISNTTPFRVWADRFGIKFLERVAEGKETDINWLGKKIKADLKIRTDITKYLIDRGYGKARQEIDLGVGDGAEVVKFTLQLGTDDSK